MIPVREKGVLYLKCQRCGYKIRVKKNLGTQYSIGGKVEEEKRVMTAKAVEKRTAALSPEEREMLQEYYEVFLESFEEE